MTLIWRCSIQLDLACVLVKQNTGNHIASWVKKRSRKLRLVRGMGSVILELGLILTGQSSLCGRPPGQEGTDCSQDMALSVLGAPHSSATFNTRMCPIPGLGLVQFNGSCLTRVFF